MQFSSYISTKLVILSLHRAAKILVTYLITAGWDSIPAASLTGHETCKLP